MGDSGDKHQKGENVLASTDNKGYVVSPRPGAPVDATAMILRPDGLKTLPPGAKPSRLNLRGASLHLDGGLDATRTRKMIFTAGMIPNIQEKPRHRKAPQRGRKRRFNAVLPALRMRVERTFAWADQFMRLLLRFERLQQRHYGRKLMAYTLLNLQEFWGV